MRRSLVYQGWGEGGVCEGSACLICGTGVCDATMISAARCRRPAVFGGAGNEGVFDGLRLRECVRPVKGAHPSSAELAFAMRPCRTPRARWRSSSCGRRITFGGRHTSSCARRATGRVNTLKHHSGALRTGDTHATANDCLAKAMNPKKPCWGDAGRSGSGEQDDVNKDEKSHGVLRSDFLHQERAQPGWALAHS